MQLTLQFVRATGEGINTLLSAHLSLFIYTPLYMPKEFVAVLAHNWTRGSVHPEQSTCVLIISMKLVRNIVSTFPRWTVQHYWFSGSKLEESKALHYCCTWRNNHSEEEAENGDDHTIAVDAPILHISPAVVSCVTFHLTKCAKSCII